MLNRMLAFADRYKAIPMFMGGALAFGTGTFKVHELYNGNAANAFLVDEQKAMALHQFRVPEYYVKYHQITIEGYFKKQIDGSGVIVFKMNSDVTRGEQDVRMTWRDTAVFRDEDGKLITRNRPCQQTYPNPEIRTPDCNPEDADGWYQHQWWRADMPKKDARSWEPWTYTQKLIPTGAYSMQICGLYDIRVYTGFIGSIDKVLNVCTRWYELNEVPLVDGE